MPSPKRAHLADAAKFGGNFHFRIRPQLFARNTIAGEVRRVQTGARSTAPSRSPACARPPRNKRYSSARALRSDSCGCGRQANLSPSSITPSLSAGERHRKLDRSSRVAAPLERASLWLTMARCVAGRLNRDHGPVHVAQGVDRSLPNDRVLAARHIAFRSIGRERTVWNRS